MSTQRSPFKGAQLHDHCFTKRSNIALIVVEMEDLPYWRSL